MKREVLPPYRPSILIPASIYVALLSLSYAAANFI